MHRFYLRSALGLVFIPVFLIVLWTSAGVRDAREGVSQTRVAAQQAERLITRAKSAAKRRPEGAEQRIAEAKAKAVPAQQALVEAEASQGGAERHARIAAIVLGIMLLATRSSFPAW